VGGLPEPGIRKTPRQHTHALGLTGAFLHPYILDTNLGIFLTVYAMMRRRSPHLDILKGTLLLVWFFGSPLGGSKTWYMYAGWPGPHSKINHPAIQLARQDERGGGRGWDGMHVRPSLTQPRRQTIWECENKNKTVRWIRICGAPR